MRFYYDEAEIRTSGNLPHWNVRGGLYFLTFRLRDSIPWRILNPLQRRREKFIRDAARQPGVASQARLIAEAKREYQIAIERTLDRNLGSCVLALPKAAELVVRALKFFDGQRYDLLAWSIMPNHAHNVFRLAEGRNIEDVMHSWKRYTALEINKLMGWRGPLWQKEYFDVTIRDRRHLDTSVKYVLNNPLKAGTSPQWTGFESDAFARCGIY